jgi:hypothetical protein
MHIQTMNIKKVLLTMAETLPEDATIYDAINQLEYTAAILEDAVASPQKPDPAWLYESSSRLLNVRNQSLRRQ